MIGKVIKYAIVSLVTGRGPLTFLFASGILALAAIRGEQRRYMNRVG